MIRRQCPQIEGQTNTLYEYKIGTLKKYKKYKRTKFKFKNLQDFLNMEANQILNQEFHQQMNEIDRDKELLNESRGKMSKIKRTIGIYLSFCLFWGVKVKIFSKF